MKSASSVSAVIGSAGVTSQHGEGARLDAKWNIARLKFKKH